MITSSLMFLQNQVFKKGNDETEGEFVVFGSQVLGVRVRLEIITVGESRWR